jgi:hypothetical protein
MNLKTGILIVLVCVALGAIIVGQRLQIRSIGFEAGQLDVELRELQEKHRVQRVELAHKRDPARIMRHVREAGIELLPPEDNLPAIPGRPRQTD